MGTTRWRPLCTVETRLVNMTRAKALETIVTRRGSSSTRLMASTSFRPRRKSEGANGQRSSPSATLRPGRYPASSDQRQAPSPQFDHGRTPFSIGRKSTSTRLGFPNSIRPPHAAGVIGRARQGPRILAGDESTGVASSWSEQSSTFRTAGQPQPLQDGNGDCGTIGGAMSLSTTASSARKSACVAGNKGSGIHDGWRASPS